MHPFKNSSIQKRAIKIALIVGTLLCIINYGDKIISNTMITSDWFKMLLTYFVPYGVSLYSAITTLKKSDQ
jgi:hypothetical protein